MCVRQCSGHAREQAVQSTWDENDESAARRATFCLIDWPFCCFPPGRQNRVRGDRGRQGRGGWCGVGKLNEKLYACVHTRAPAPLQLHFAGTGKPTCGLSDLAPGTAHRPRDSTRYRPSSYIAPLRSPCRCSFRWTWAAASSTRAPTAPGTTSRAATSRRRSAACPVSGRGRVAAEWARAQRGQLLRSFTSAGQLVARAHRRWQVKHVVMTCCAWPCVCVRLAGGERNRLHLAKTLKQVRADMLGGSRPEPERIGLAGLALIGPCGPVERHRGGTHAPSQQPPICGW